LAKQMFSKGFAVALFTLQRKKHSTRSRHCI